MQTGPNHRLPDYALSFSSVSLFCTCFSPFFAIVELCALHMCAICYPPHPFTRPFFFLVRLNKLASVICYTSIRAIAAAAQVRWEPA